ncbi:hypothetical protein [Shewanella zhangzhouensis]|uniref:hypothetical protein n=1 Tax=Shewanella zhangzhouensis TaxID=2864213 RepID=UPI001C662244|nr:hypothetical protein [Shewanella zhangzhouensis]QYK05604.1 hypothetical protein K0H63_01755 [Shewanella zhangzhouensis]
MSQSILHKADETCLRQVFTVISYIADVVDNFLGTAEFKKPIKPKVSQTELTDDEKFGG